MPNQLKDFTIGVSVTNGLVNLSIKFDITLTSQAAALVANDLAGLCKIDDADLSSILHSSGMAKEQKMQIATKLNMAVMILQS